MAAVSLGEFIRVNRQEVILRCRRRATLIANWPSSEADVERGIPLFLDQLMVELGHESSQTRAIRKTATEHGQDLFFQGFTVAQVVHDYGNVCQTVTDLATEQAIPISTDDFRTLNRCLDDAIAGAVTGTPASSALVGDGQSHELRTSGQRGNHRVRGAPNRKRRCHRHDRRPGPSHPAGHARAL